MAPSKEDIAYAAEEAKALFVRSAEYLADDHILLSAFIPVPAAWAEDPLERRELGEAVGQAGIDVVATWARKRGHDVPEDTTAQPIYLNDPGTMLGRLLAAQQAIGQYADRAMVGTGHKLSMVMVPVPDDNTDKVGARAYIAQALLGAAMDHLAEISGHDSATQAPDAMVDAVAAAMTKVRQQGEASDGP